jgi:hypothetical protein
MDDGLRMVVETETADEPPSVAVTEALATASGVDTVDLDVALAEYVDPCALDRIFRDRRPDGPREGAVSFTVAGAAVTVEYTPSGGLTVRVEVGGEIRTEARSPPTERASER